MKKKIITAVAAGIFLLGSALSSLVYAQGCGPGGGEGHCKQNRGPKIETKLFSSLHAALSNKDELGLSDEQNRQIKNLKIALKKDLIKRTAEIEILDVDFNAALWEDTINKDNVYQLIEQKYDLKKQKTKVLVDAYATLKTILSTEQKAKLTNLQRQCRKK